MQLCPQQPVKEHMPLLPFSGTALKVHPRRRSTQGSGGLCTRPIVMSGLALTVEGMSLSIVFLQILPFFLEQPSDLLLRGRTWTYCSHADCLKARQCASCPRDDFTHDPFVSSPEKVIGPSVIDNITISGSIVQGNVSVRLQWKDSLLTGQGGS